MEKILDKFDYGIDRGESIADTSLIWCSNEKGFQIRSVNRDLDLKNNPVSPQPYHNFGILNSNDVRIICAKDFEYSQQNYLLVVLKKQHLNILCIYNVKTTKVQMAFQLHDEVINLDVFVAKNQCENIISKFQVCAFCGCNGGAIYLIDITPRFELTSSVQSPLDIYLASIRAVYENLEVIVEKAFKERKVFCILLNESCVKDAKIFDYTMPDDKVEASLSRNDVKITSIKYEKQSRSLLIGFNFGCFQIWNMTSLTIDSSSEFRNINKPIVGFSVLEPQNDPKQCLYLVIGHSSSIESKQHNYNPQYYEIDDDNESDSSFMFIYQLNYERKKFLLNQFELDYELNYTIYESLNSCKIAFEHDFNSNTFVYSNLNNGDESRIENCSMNEDEVLLSKIISMQTIKVHNNGLDVEFSCIFWTLINKNTSSYYLTMFNLNNWYSQCMPGSLDKKNKNMCLNNFNLCLNSLDLDYTSIKSMNIYESNIKRLKSCHDDSILSIYLEIRIMSSFLALRYTIKPIEEQIKEFINKEDNIFNNRFNIYNLLYKNRLIPLKPAHQDEYLMILNYLLENSELCAITKSLRNLASLDTSIISSISLKTVVDWIWFRFKEIKNEVCVMSKHLFEELSVFDKQVEQVIKHNMKLVKNLLKIYDFLKNQKSTDDGRSSLNKSKIVLESFELYCEHLCLCIEHQLLPEIINTDTSENNLFQLSILDERWRWKRENLKYKINNYNFHFIIDLIMNDCKKYANISKLIKHSQYPPKTVHEILEIFLECNLSLAIKQIIFLYFLIDIKENISISFAEKIQNLINDYCKNEQSKNNLLNIAFGIYHMDNQEATKSYDYFKNCDLKLLDSIEKHQILYNLAYLNEWPKALEFLSIFLTSAHFNMNENDIEMKEIASKLMIRIYLSNNLINQAYDIVKKASDDEKLYKLLNVFLLSQSEPFPTSWSKVTDLFKQNQIYCAYLEAKEDSSSICKVIDIYCQIKNYERAIYLYERHSRKLDQTKESEMIKSMIETIKKSVNYTLNKPENTISQLNITSIDIKNANERNISNKLINKDSSIRCSANLNEEFDKEYIKVLSIFKIDTLCPLAPISLPKPTDKTQKTPPKPNASILKSTTIQSSTLITNTQLTPGKSVKFKLTNSKDESQIVKQTEFLEPFEIVNLKEKMQELHKSPSAGSLDSIMSTISSRSAVNLPARLADFENDEKLMNEDRVTCEPQNNDDYQMFSNESSNTSLNSNEQEREEAFKLPDKVLFKQPIEKAVNQNEVSKISSVESLANSTVSSRTGTGLAERLNDFETETIEENFNPIEKTHEPQGIIHVNSMASIKSTISSQSAKNLQERLQDFENESISDYKIPGNDFAIESNNLRIDNEQNATIQDYEYNSEIIPISNQITESSQTKLENISSSQISTLLTDDQGIDDEIIFSISDDDNNNNNDVQSSFTSISSKFTDYSSMTADNVDLSSTKITKRKTGGRKSNVTALAAAFEVDQLNDGPLTRSRIKAQSNRLSINEIASSQEPSLPPTPQKRPLRNTRSMTRSPSPTNSVLSTASTTVARNKTKSTTIKRRGSNSIKKPAKVLSPEIQITESSPTEGKRYNLRNRKTLTPNKDLDETQLTTPVKKGRKTINRKNSLYKIDEASDNLIKQHKAESLKENENEFFFSNPHDTGIEKSAKNYRINQNENNKGASSFTFSPPLKSPKK